MLRNALRYILVVPKAVILIPFLLVLAWPFFLMSIDRTIGLLHWYLTKKKIRSGILFGAYRSALKQELISSYIPWGVNKACDMGIGYRKLEESDFKRRRGNLRNNLRDRILLNVRNRVTK